MEVIKYAALAVMASCSPALAQECIPADEAYEAMIQNGYTVTFWDSSGEWIMLMAEDGKGGWVMFAVQGNVLCPLVGGSEGTHEPPKPNT